MKGFYVKVQDLLRKTPFLSISTVSINGMSLLRWHVLWLHYMGCRMAMGLSQKILERENDMSTGIGYGIAIPHARISGIDRL
jgi:mannitol/fructose-specific phosphotransferase system IIA component